MKGQFALLVAAFAVLVPAAGHAAGAPAIAFNPSSHDFGVVAVDADSATQEFSLTNSGSNATGALNVSLSPDSSPAFSIIDDHCTAVSLGPKKSCTVTVKYDPTSPGSSDTGTLNAMSKKPAARASASLSGLAADTDLSLDLTMDLTSDLDGNASLTIGDRVTFTLTLDNAGPNTAANVHVADRLPPPYHFFTSVASQGTYTSATGDWNVGAVSVPSTPTLSIVATVSGGHPVSAYTNYAQVTASAGFDPDSTPANNSTTEDDDASFTPPIADLSVTNAVALAPGGDLDGSGSLTVGDQLVFTVTVSNAGPEPAPGVRLVDLARGNGFTYVGDDGLGSYDGVTGLWTLPGTMAPGTTQTLHITATADPNGPYTNTAQVVSMGDFPPPSGISLYLDPDSTPNNNVPTEDDQATVSPIVQPSG